MDTFLLDLHDPVRRVALIAGSVAPIALAIALPGQRPPLPEPG